VRQVGRGDHTDREAVQRSGQTFPASLGRLGRSG
jgi:hypothetical protein